MRFSQRLNQNLAFRAKLFSTHEMSRFSNALQKILDSHSDGRGFQGAFARRAGIDPSGLSRYLRGDTRPDVEALESICLLLTEHERAELVTAYLRDDIPPSARDLVQVVSLIGGNRVAEETPASAYSQLPKRGREIFDFLMTEALNHAVVLDAMESTVNLMRGREP
jgi:transcriptional regulator with XRE-family HTH domain